MSVNKVIYNGKTLINLENDTVTPETLATGATAHDASGKAIEGTMPTTTVLYTAQTLTEAQKAQARKNIGVPNEEDIVQQVITALGTPVFGRVDEDNNIILTGELADGTYTIKYEDADGEQTEIGNIEIGESYINRLPLAIGSDGNPYNGGQGWKANTRLNSSGAETAKEGMEVTGFIPAKYGDVLRMRNITFNYFASNSAYRDNTYLTFYDSSFAFLGYRKTFSEEIDTGLKDIVINDVVQNNTGLGSYTGSNASKVAYIRISSSDISNNSIITINQEITE